MQQQHPIDNMMQTTMENIRSMVDVNTVVGAPVNGTHGTTIIPISKVSVGFVAGGGEYAVEDGKNHPIPTDVFPAARARACRCSRWGFWWWETAW